MKAQDSVKNYPSALREMTNFSVRGIKKICKDVGPRPAGSEQEHEAQKLMAAELDGACDKVEIEPFDVHPGAFLGWILTDGIMMIAAIVLFFFGMSAIALALCALSLIFAIVEFLLYKKLLDPFFPKKTSHNVVAVRKPKGEVKRRIIFSGHADSANEWRFTYYGGSKLLVPIIGLSFVGILLGLVLGIWAVAAGHAFSAADSGALNVMRYVFLAWIPILFTALFFENKKRPVMGANDDLTGCFISMAVVKYMQQHDIRFENTEVWVVLTGSEEAGLRGAKAFCKAHKNELSDVETVFVGLDTIRDYDFAAVYSRDLTGTVKNDAGACALVKEAAKQTGLDLPYKSVFFGATDAAAVTQAGMKAVSVAAMDPAPAKYYHTRLDTADNLDIKTVEAVLGVALETAFLFDEKGLSD
jgi:aminopeptidase YwaD